MVGRGNTRIHFMGVKGSGGDATARKGKLKLNRKENQMSEDKMGDLFCIAATTSDV